MTEAAIWSGDLQEKLAVLRPFAFQYWPVYSEATFNFTARQRILPEKSIFSDNLQIYGSDINKDNIRLTTENIARLGLDVASDFVDIAKKSIIHLTTADFFKTDKKTISVKNKMLLLFNPPYGKRLKIDKKTFFSQIGSHLKKHYKGCDVLMIVPDEEAEKAINIYYEKKWVFRNGGLSVAALFFHL